MSKTLMWLSALHLAGNAMLLGLGYYWLGIGESNAANLALSAAVLLVFVTGAVWLHGTSLAYFRDPAPSPGAMLARPLRRLLPLAVLAIAVTVLYFALNAWRPLDDQASATVASFLTMTFQKRVRPAAIQSIFNPLWWLLLRVVIPVVLLPVASGIAARGWKGFTEFGAGLRSLRYWLLASLLLIGALWAPLALVVWKPITSSFSAETASLIARFGLAYLLFVGACLLLAFVTSRGKPSLIQPSTTVSP